MVILHAKSGSRGFEILEEGSLTQEKTNQVIQAVCQLLRARNDHEAANFLESWSFIISPGTNGFDDEFYVLHVTLPLQEYVEVSKYEGHNAFFRIARAIQELSNYYIRFVIAKPKIIISEIEELVPHPNIHVTLESVSRAIKDAQQLIETSGPISAIDRVHTVFHGYLRELCQSSDITIPTDAPLTTVFKRLREEHLAFKGDLTDESKRMMSSLAQIIDSLNLIRNRQSVAHPNPELIGDAEARLAINSCRTLLQFIAQKTQAS